MNRTSSGQGAVDRIERAALAIRQSGEIALQFRSSSLIQLHSMPSPVPAAVTGRRRLGMQRGPVTPSIDIRAKAYKRDRRCHRAIGSAPLML